jgi:DNA-binding SARP family transcriptional activator
MRLYAVEGNRGQALHIYHTCAEVLSRELNVAPGPAIRSLYQQLLHCTNNNRNLTLIYPGSFISHNKNWFNEVNEGRIH